jgi:hypothetical protein
MQKKQVENRSQKNEKALPFMKVLFLNLCDSEAIRTPDRLLRRQMLYPAELRNPL